MLMISSSPVIKHKSTTNIINRLSSSFALKDLGQLHYFLGIEVVHHHHNLILSQRKYILDIIHRVGLSQCKPVATPMSTSHVLLPDDSPLLPDPSRFRQVVVKRILRYLHGTAQLGLLFRHDSSLRIHAFSDSYLNHNLLAYSDSDWAGCPVDRRSTGGYAVYLGSTLISWAARKQRTVSPSSTESEYKALADAVAELIWLKSLLQELGVVSQSPTLWCDNLGATYLSANPVFHARTKHVEVDFHFVREQVAQGKLNVKFISTNDQLADVFAKPLPSHRFLGLRSKLQEKEAVFCMCELRLKCYNCDGVFFWAPTEDHVERRSTRSTETERRAMSPPLSRGAVVDLDLLSDAERPGNA
ncbi:hypothetical protein E3N88_20454 [Mikania micrantha]|uniref:Reverse transcriptase Ty1/copia-type domain-containing protein n=1 Tax=Mikania micrantha TaxID=192012 RepID=A0A5N6NH14_9ASTR|nr:hypothetical protein E3N88_20454 [Mikania micrantha]